MKIEPDWLFRASTQAVTGMLEAAGHQALFVGGCVRNALLEEPVSDLDIATDAPPDRVMDLAAQAGLKALPTGIDHGTVTLISGGIPHEVTTFRRDVATDGRRAVVAFSTDVTDDARRRDFTMNALYCDPRGQIIDPLGGLPDLRARRVLFIEDPHRRIREDYLRILRFFRFHAWYGTDGIDAEGLSACAALADGIDRLARERVGQEMLKLLRAPDPSPAVASMAVSGVLRHVLPGAEPATLASLVHLEQSHGIAPDALRRLVAIGGEDVTALLRLSKAQDTQRSTLIGASGSTDLPAALGYRLGADAGHSAVLLRAAALGAPLPDQALRDVVRGAEQVFPLAARDLMPDLTGPALGRALKTAEEDWIASGFTLSREALISRHRG